MAHGAGTDVSAGEYNLPQMIQMSILPHLPPPAAAYHIWEAEAAMQRRADDLEEASELAAMGVFIGRSYSIEPGLSEALDR